MLCRHRFVRTALYAAGTSAVLFLAACTIGQAPSGTDGGTSQGTADITVTATDLKLEPPSFTVTAGQPVRLTFINKGAIEHDWSAPGLSATNVAIGTMPTKLSPSLQAKVKDQAAKNIPHPAAGPGESMLISFTPTSPGTFDVICEVPGHKEAGMVARMVVRDADGTFPAQADRCDSAARPTSR